MNLEKYRTLFVDETSDYLVEMSGALAALERSDSKTPPEECIDTLFRVAHSIKGMAASLDYDAASSLAHHLEDWLEPARESGSLPEGGVQLAYEIVGAFEQMVAEIDAQGDAPTPRDDLVRRLSGQAEAPTVEAPTVPRPATQPSSRSVRVRADAVDRFLAAVGELMQRHAQLEALHRAFPVWDLRREFADELDGMERVIRELRRRALDIRTTPVRRALERLPRVASELAHGLGKRVEVDLIGEEVEVDRAVLDHLDEPLLHLVRNAVDHGIEAPKVREAAGKPPFGHIQLRVARAGSSVQVRIEDDGAGLDIEKVRSRAVERGLLPELVAEDLPLERVSELLFEPGMSTRDEVSEVSGRGVGLDAVKRSIEALGGTVSIESRPGEGTAFQVELPSMVALQRVLILQLAGQRIAMPVGRVDVLLKVTDGMIDRAGGEAFFLHKDEPIPLLDLGERLGVQRMAGPDAGDVVVVEVREFRVGLHVDRVLGEHEVFVREVPSALEGLNPLAGVAILPDGVPVFLLEAGALVEDFA